MSGPVTKQAYELLIKDDVKLIEQHCPPSLERDHIIAVLQGSIACYYPEPESSESEQSN